MKTGKKAQCFSVCDFKIQTNEQCKIQTFRKSHGRSRTAYFFGADVFQWPMAVLVLSLSIPTVSNHHQLGNSGHDSFILVTELLSYVG